MQFSYKSLKPLKERKEEYQKVIDQNPEKVAIIVENDPRSDIADIEKKKFLIKEDMNLTQFQKIIRNRLKMDEKEALFFLANGKTSLAGNFTIREIYDKYKDEDGFLYIAYSSQEVWGY